MRRGYFILLALAFFVLKANGQTVRTDVLVLGNGSNALAAGIQAAVSGVKVTVLMRDPEFEIINPKGGLNSGVQAEYFDRTSGKSERSKDAIINWTDSVKNLTVIKNVAWSKIKRAGGGWSVELADGRKIRVYVLVNAEGSGELNNALLLQNNDLRLRNFNYADNNYRTSVASGIVLGNSTATYLTMEDLFLRDQENLVVLDPRHGSLVIGQAAGAAAAYAAFFKKKTSETNLKELQGELVKYKLSLVPFVDVSVTDTNWRSIQFIGLSGILKGIIHEGGLHFGPEMIVKTSEIRDVVKEYYYKAQIWFDDYQSEDMTLGSTLALFCYVKGKSLESTTAEVMKKWTTLYGFKQAYNADKVVNRREFAVLSGDYLQPFNVTIDKTGRVTR